MSKVCVDVLIVKALCWETCKTGEVREDAVEGKKIENLSGEGSESADKD